MSCKNCNIKSWGCEGCIYKKQPKVRPKCSDCGKREAIVKGKCRPCYHAEKYDKIRKVPRVETGISFRQLIEVING